MYMKTNLLPLAAVCAALVATGAAWALPADEIASRICAGVAETKAGYNGFRVDVVQITTDADGKEMSRVTGRLFFSKPDETRFEVTSYVEGGQKKEIPKDEGGKKKTDDFELKTPFEREYCGDYRFTLEGEEEVTGVGCYKVGFAAPGHGKGYVYGTAWVAQDDFGLIKTSGKPYVQPEHCSASAMTTYYRAAGGKTMPYKQVIYVKASFLKVINKEMWFTSYFTDYRFD